MSCATRKYYSVAVRPTMLYGYEEGLGRHDGSGGNDDGKVGTWACGKTLLDMIPT